MAKTRAPHPNQLPFDWDAPQPATQPAALGGSDAKTARMVAEALKGEDRAKISARMTVLLDEDISKAMLDAYASPARDGHNIAYHRMLGLISVTNRFDLLDNSLRPIGAALLVGDEIYTAEIGHIDSEISKLQQRRKDLARLHPTITRNHRK